MMASAKYWPIVLAFVCQAYGNINIIGHQTPLIVGNPRNITCTWSNGNAATMEWYLVGVNAVSIVSQNSTNKITLPIDSASGLDGARFRCRVTTFDGEQSEETATLAVKQLTNRVEIQASSEEPVAGELFTLTCIVTSDMRPQVKWLGPNGESLDGELQDETGLISTLTFNLLHTSHGGTYTCVSRIESQHSSQDETYSLIVRISSPVVSITRQPFYPVPLCLNDELMMKCIVQIIPEVDTPVTLHSGWRGHSSLSDVHRVNISEWHGLQPTYLSMTTFSALLSKDTGSYICWAYVSPNDTNNFVLPSSQSSDTIMIHVGLRVNIHVTYDPPLDLNLPSPPYYRPGTSVTLTCSVLGAVGAVSFQWSSTCSYCFASRTTAPSISQNTLLPRDAGVHTCTVTDWAGNAGNSSTQMQLMGSGIKVQRGSYYPSSVASNNSILLSSLTCCSRVDLYCYSNSTTEGQKYLIWPDGTRFQPSHCHYCEMCISRYSYGMRIYSYSNYHPGMGIYTCQLQDSNGNLIDMSFGVYSSMPQPPNITAMEYTNLMDNADHAGSAIANVICITENSPPTNVIWMMDGSMLDIDGQNYSVLQTVTDRRRSQYRNTLMIKKLFKIVGTHAFTCLITNIAGNVTESITTYLPAIPVVNTFADTLPIISKEVIITCAAYMQAFSDDLLPHLHLEWVGLSGNLLVTDSTLTVGEQRIEASAVVRDITFHSLKYSHSGRYTCRATLNTGNEMFTAETNHTLIISSQALFQLRFGPFEHCTQWYHDETISSHLERDIKSSVITFINEKSNHNFPLSIIDKGEFSCQTTSSSITYRACITGSENTLTSSVLTELIQEWIFEIGTFTYTYRNNEEIEMDPYCPLKIESFSVPECGTGNITITGHETPILLGNTQDIICTWNGHEADEMEWYLVGLDAIPIESAPNTNTLVLSSYPNTAALDGTMFTCRVTIGLDQYEQTITLFVERLENDILIEVSADPPRAGDDFTLTCRAFSDKPTQLTWMDANGLPVGGENLFVSSKLTNGISTSVDLTFHKLRTSQAGVYTCVSVTGPSKKNESILVQVEIPPPDVTIKRDHSQIELYATNPLTVTCTVEVNPAVDTLVIVNAAWKGHSSLFDNGERVIISKFEGLHPYYESEVNFTSLKYEDAGEYFCLANISSLSDSSFLIPASSQADTTISIALNVTIRIIYNRLSSFTELNPPYYHPASSITLICNTDGVSETLTYSWTSTCRNCYSWTYTTQTVNIEVLTSNYAGIYTCTVTDSTGKSTSGSTEIKLKGSGMYIETPNIQYSVNNSIVVVSPYTSSSCYERLKLSCYSNATSYNTEGYVVAYDGHKYISSQYKYLYAYRRTPAGLYLQYRACSSYSLHYGVYTCELPDANGKKTESSVAVYSYTPGAPVIERITFNNLLLQSTEHDHNSALVEITCSTKISPPTNVTWLRDGKKLNMDDTLYQTVFRVTDRINYLYNTTLVIRDAMNIGGIHKYTCIVSNTRGEDQMTISTNVTELFAVDILPLTMPIHGHNFTLKCVATPSRGQKQILPYLTLEWIQPSADIRIGLQKPLTDNKTRAMQFSPLTGSHSGVYTCRVQLNVPNAVGNYASSRDFDLVVFNYTYIQLKFGPIIHCTIFHKNEEMAAHLKHEVSHFLAKIVDKMCKCGYQNTMIDLERIGCHTQTSMLVYRARIAGSSHTLSTSHLMALIEEWLQNDSTFLYTYYGRIRLRADPHCPLEITSFTEPECGLNME